MKNLLVLFIVILAGTISAQDTTQFPYNIKYAVGHMEENNSFIKKVNIGLIGGESFNTNKHDSDLESVLLSNITLVTTKTYHNLIFNYGNESIMFLNGYFLGKNWDVYLLAQKWLKEDKKNFGIGVEKEFNANEVSLVSFVEITNNFKGQNTFSVGILISLQNTIWEN